MHFPWGVRAKFGVYLRVIIVGALTGIFVLYPASEFVYFKEYGPPRAATSSHGALHFVAEQMRRSLVGQTPRKTAFYAAVGIVLSTVGATLLTSMQRRAQEIARLRSALEEDLNRLIERGESATLEFKSTFRWDLREGKANRALEGVVLKTLAGYLNGNGGTLLIGVADDGRIVGLKHDYAVLKKQDRDGFEQALMTAVASKLGADTCRYVQVIFHTIQTEEVCRVFAVPAHRPVYIKDGDNLRFYVRTGVSTRELNVQEAVNYASARWPK